MAFFECWENRPLEKGGWARPHLTKQPQRALASALRLWGGGGVTQRTLSKETRVPRLQPGSNVGRRQGHQRCNEGVTSPCWKNSAPTNLKNPWRLKGSIFGCKPPSFGVSFYSSSSYYYFLKGFFAATWTPSVSMAGWGRFCFFPFSFSFRVWLVSFLASWLFGFLASWLLGFLASWLLGFSASSLLGFWAFRLFVGLCGIWLLRLFAGLCGFWRLWLCASSAFPVPLRAFWLCHLPPATFWISCTD